MAVETSENYKIEQFTLEEKDFGRFVELITTAFLADEAAQQEGATIVFNEPTFRIMFGAPSINR
ncbi:MAG: hypothetical protein ACTSYG_06010, partial [Candidatus Heimdallarchaeota archaeon]